jgi:energy-coupling factor transport system permease protein
MAEAPSLYKHRDSAVHRLHPVTKLAWVGFLLVCGLTLPGIWSTYALLALVLVPLAVWARILKELAGAAWKTALPFAVSVFLVQGFLWPHGTPLVTIGPLSLKQEGLTFAAATGRILVIVSSFLWFAFTTRPDVLMSSLVQRGLPSSLAYLVVATIQIVPRFQARAAAILDAQQARGLQTAGSLALRVRAVLPLVIPLILSSLVDVEERALAIEARAFNHPGRKTSLIEITEARWELLLRWGLALAAAGCLALSIYIRVTQ